MKIELDRRSISDKKLKSHTSAPNFEEKYKKNHVFFLEFRNMSDKW